jgi:hypothetical protein
MISTVPQWPYLVLIEGEITLQESEPSATELPLGDYCGEWGSHLDREQKPDGVRLMFLFDFLSRDADFARANNVREDADDLIVLFRDSRLPDADACPFLPVYRACRLDGREILQLSGYE